MSITLHTLGHSDRTLNEFLGLLNAAELHTIVDVRQQPYSSRHPHFGQDALREALTSAGFEYHWAGRQLGGHRAAQAVSPHVALVEDGMRGFADYMGSEPFKKGAAQLLQLASRAATAILCAEREPLKCHRSLIADYLTLQGVTVMHLVDALPAQAHLLRPEVRRESAELIYDRGVTAALL
ncbi:MAG: DUF488 domain-containing protein [Gammaproteobacteria bacterium]|nr:DUF488 domain-containing protein [Gammaproteobacteria bacterium]